MIKGLNNKKKAITRLMKNAPKSIYGYYQETPTSCAYLCFSYGIIEITPGLLEIIPDDIPKLTDKKTIEKALNFYNDILKAIEKERYIKDVTINDLKVYKKHIKKIASHKLGTNSKDPFLVEYKKGGYIGLNPSFLIDLCVLTEEKDYTCITVTNESNPFLISGAGIQAILCPVVANANEISYDYFLNNVYECRQIDEGIKTLKEINKKDYKKTKVDNIPILTGKHANEITIKSGYIFSDKNCDFLIYKDKRTYTVYNLNMMLPVSKDEFKTITAAIDYLYSFWKPDKDYIDCVKNILVNSNGKKETENRLKTISENEIVKPYINKYFFDCTETKEETTTPDTCADDMSATATDPETIEAKTADNMSATDTTTAATTDTANNDSVKTDNSRKKILHGFYMTFKNRDIFVATNEDMKRRYIIQAFISEMINISNHLQNITEEKRNNILNDEDVLKETKKRITPATIEEIHTYKENHIRITSDNNNMIVNHSLNNFKTIVIDCFSANEGITPAQETALKFFKGISDINNRTTETMQADARQDARQTETTQDTTPKQAETKTATSNNKSVSLFIVKDKPQPVKLPHLKPLNNIPMFQERFKTDFKPLKSHRVYNNRVSNIKPLKKAYNDFNNPVSCYSDKCAISGDITAVNSS